VAAPKPTGQALVPRKPGAEGGEGT